MRSAASIRLRASQRPTPAMSARRGRPGAVSQNRRDLHRRVEPGRPPVLDPARDLQVPGKAVECRREKGEEDEDDRRRGNGGPRPAAGQDRSHRGRDSRSAIPTYLPTYLPTYAGWRENGQRQPQTIIPAKAGIQSPDNGLRTCPVPDTGQGDDGEAGCQFHTLVCRRTASGIRVAEGCLPGARAVPIHPI